MAGLQAGGVEMRPGGDGVQSDHQEEYLELAWALSTPVHHVDILRAQRC